MYTALKSIVPDPKDLLSLEVEELGGVLLMHLNSFDGHEGSVVQNGRISQQNFYAENRAGHYPEHPSSRDRVDLALKEAWAWLQSEGFLVVDPEVGRDWFFISRRGQRFKTREDLAAYRKVSLLPRTQLHPLIAGRVYPAFLRGEYDTAIFQAFREIEVAVRQASTLPQNLVGVSLMRAAFTPPKNNLPAGPLADMQLPVGEQDAMAHLFAGAFGVYRNSTGHRHVPTDPAEAAEVLMFTSQLLRIVDRLASKL
jgi:uncharacterized protein (TIGR02391 family)